MVVVKKLFLTFPLIINVVFFVIKLKKSVYVEINSSKNIPDASM